MHSSPNGFSVSFLETLPFVSQLSARCLLRPLQPRSANVLQTRTSYRRSFVPRCMDWLNMNKESDKGRFFRR